MNEEQRKAWRSVFDRASDGERFVMSKSLPLDPGLHVLWMVDVMQVLGDSTMASLESDNDPK